MDVRSRPQQFGLLAGLFLATGLVLSAMLFTRAWLKIKEPMTVTVKGSARKNVRSDIIVWHGSFSVEAETLLAAQQALRSDLAKVEAFYRKNGVIDYKVSAIGITALTQKTKTEELSKTVGYSLNQSLEIQSQDVEKITRFARNCTALIEQGVLFVSAPPEYIYTKAGETKVEMLAEATKDARVRAEQMAQQGGRKISQLRSAEMGIFQITPLYSTATSYSGENDTSSLEKTITSVVTASFAMQ